MEDSKKIRLEWVPNAYIDAGAEMKTAAKPAKPAGNKLLKNQRSNKHKK